LEKVGRLVDFYVQCAEEVELYTIGRSVASTELEESRFSIKEEIDTEGLDWVMQDEESHIGNWAY
jgi:hypothetical protein